MNALQITATLEKDGVLILKGLPFSSGQQVEICITPFSPTLPSEADRYPLRGMSYRYDDPTEPVAVDDWEALH